jgi:beta-lactamase class D
MKTGWKYGNITTDLGFYVGFHDWVFNHIIHKTNLAIVTHTNDLGLKCDWMFSD